MHNYLKTAFLTLLFVAQTSFAGSLEHLQDWMEGIVEDGKVAGCMAQVTRDGETIFLEAVGARSPKADDALKTSQVVRIYSMTKGITSVAIMQLIEDGKLGLDDPVSMYLPQFKNMNVFEDGVLRPAKKQITIRELLTHTSGLAYHFTAPPELVETYENLELPKQTNMADAVDLMATAPLVHDPGAGATYGISTDVLGAVVEKASGQTFGQYLKERVFKPLDMKHTTFFVGMDRLKMPFVAPSDEGVVFDELLNSEDSPTNPKFEAGGMALWSTLGDYTNFCLALEQGGELNGKRILKPETIEFMMQNHISPSITKPMFPEIAGNQFGLGFDLAIPVNTSKGERGAGRWSWSGAANTHFFIDPVENVTAVFATQLYPFTWEIKDGFHQAVYEALVQDED